MAETLTTDVALPCWQHHCHRWPAGVLITTLGPIQAPIFNPVVSLVFALRASCLVSGRALRDGQIIGGVLGAVAAHALFALPLLQASTTIRTGGAQWFSEGVAAFGLVATILAGLRFERRAVPMLVGLYITAAYWFTASTSFANPAVAIARAFTDTFSGIRPLDLPGFILAQIAGALVALALMTWLLAGSTGDDLPLNPEDPS